jgi:hypothetical protein
MSPSREGGCRLDRRRFVLGAGALASAGLVEFGVPAVVDAGGRGRKRVAPAPEPIPGGLQFPGIPLIHVSAPGDPSVTLPFTGGTLQGFDVEPGTITDFRGSSAVAFHVGTAHGHDGTEFNLETDMRAFEGEFVVDGVTHRGSFGFV